MQDNTSLVSQAHYQQQLISQPNVKYISVNLSVIVFVRIRWQDIERILLAYANYKDK